MTDEKNRVLARKGAHFLTPDEIAQVGGFGTPVRFTETVTFNSVNGSLDHVFDEKEA